MADVSKYDCLLDIVRNRRSIRQFKPDPVPDEHITKIIEVARWAPSAFHTQPWEFAVVKDPNVKAQIISILDGKSPPITDPEKEGKPRRSFRDAPVYIFLLCDWRASAGLPGQASANSRQVNNLYYSSLASTFVYMHLAATSLGLASQWYTSTSRAGVEDEIKKIIGIPEALTIYDMMVLGYADAEPGPKIVRDIEEMIHYDNCGVQDFRTDAEVKAYTEITKAWCLSEH